MALRGNVGAAAGRACRRACYTLGVPAAAPDGCHSLGVARFPWASRSVPSTLHWPLAPIPLFSRCGAYIGLQNQHAILLTFAALIYNTLSSQLPLLPRSHLHFITHRKKYNSLAEQLMSLSRSAAAASSSAGGGPAALTGVAGMVPASPFDGTTQSASAGEGQQDSSKSGRLENWATDCLLLLLLGGLLELWAATVKTCRLGHMGICHN